MLAEEAFAEAFLTWLEVKVLNFIFHRFIDEKNSRCFIFQSFVVVDCENVSLSIRFMAN